MSNNRINSFNIMTRRAFLDRSFKVGMATALSTLVNIPFVMKQALASGIGQPGANGKVKKLLFIWLRFGNDGLNTVIPIQDSAYNTDLRPAPISAKIRPNIAIAKEGDIYSTQGPCDDPSSPTPGTATFAYTSGIRLGNGFAALHPALKFLAPVYNSGDLAVIHRVAYPKQSRSHFDSQNYWENGAPNSKTVKDGIFYRTMVASGLANTAPLTGVSIQTSLPLILRGSEAPMTNLTDPTRYDLLGVPNPAADAKALAALREGSNYPAPSRLSRDFLALQHQNLSSTLNIFSGMNFNESGNTFVDNANTDGDTLPYYLFPTANSKNGGYAAHSNDTNKYVVPTSQYSFFRNLKAAAMILNNTDAIITGTEIGGFDTHGSQGGATGNHANLLRAVGWALYGLRKYFMNYGNKVTWDDVVVVTLSEFGRTSIENSDAGTDHAEAGPMFVCGGGVKGYNAGNPSGVFNCGPSDPIPWVTGLNGTMFNGGNYLKRTTDYRSILGEVIKKHLAATPTQMEDIITGYKTEPELKNQNVVANSSADNVPITGELGIL